LLAVLAWQGYGIMSFMWAALARSIVGLVTIYIVSPWRIQIGISKKSAKELFRFGIPYQLNSFLALVKDDLLYLTLGRIFPPQYSKEFMGYIFIAKKLSELPLRIVLDSVTRVTFPAFSRLQNHKEALSKALNNTTFGIGILIFPVYITGIFFIGPFIELLPRYAKWEPALLTFYMLCITQIAASFSTPLVSALNAIGKVKISLLLMIMWIVLTWSLMIPLVPILGLNSFGFALMIVSLTVFPVVWICNRYIKFSFYQQVKVPFVTGIVLAVWYYAALSFIQPTFLLLLIVMITGGLLYSGVVYTFERKKIVFIVRGVLGK
jgi:O-antigen/teichoic acid export membrane protein